MATTYYGIDVSQWNGNVNFTEVKKTKSFVMIRAGYGSYISQKDPKFDINYKNAVKAGLHVGAYWYSYATTTSAAVAEAKTFLTVIKGKKFDFPVALDIEDQCQSKLSSATLGAIVDAFRNTIEKAGYYMQLYSYEAFLNRIPVSVRNKSDIWCANITKKPSITYSMHQYSFTGKVGGCPGATDLDQTTKDYPSIIKKAGLNGYPKSSTPAPKPNTKKILDKTGFKKGDSGDGVFAVKALLFLANKKGLIKVDLDGNDKFGNGTASAINTLLKKWGYKETGIAGQGFINKLYNELKK